MVIQNLGLNAFSSKGFNAHVLAANNVGRFVCVGLDPEWDRIPREFKARTQDHVEMTILEFNKDRILQTHGQSAMYKLNLAFYVAQGTAGIAALIQTIKYIRKEFPWIPVALDQKIGDIGNTNEGYVKFILEQCGLDAVTLNPYVGGKALQPFLKHPELGCIILCRTSNEGAEELQDALTLVSYRDLEQLIGREALYGSKSDQNMKELDWAAVEGWGIAMPHHHLVACTPTAIGMKITIACWWSGLQFPNSFAGSASSCQI